MPDAAAQERPPFEGWAVVEVMGHKKFAGHVSEQVLGSAALVRVDVPATSDENGAPQSAAYTKLLGVASIYCITPCSEGVARQVAQRLERWNDPIPVSIPTQRLLPSAEDADFDMEDDRDA